MIICENLDRLALVRFSKQLARLISGEMDKGPQRDCIQHVARIEPT